MDTSCLQNRLTPQEREQFEQEGYLVVKEALPLFQCDALTQIVDNILDFSPFMRLERVCHEVYAIVSPELGVVARFLPTLYNSSRPISAV
ncbi:MAG: hypothetical protein NT023_23870 [Armatimonadetes bacterium]|nr:hypothetical protein [Armatimonadota bacterium]